MWDGRDEDPSESHKETKKCVKSPTTDTKSAAATSSCANSTYSPASRGSSRELLTEYVIRKSVKNVNPKVAGTSEKVRSVMETEMIDQPLLQGRKLVKTTHPNKAQRPTDGSKKNDNSSNSSTSSKSIVKNRNRLPYKRKSKSQGGEPRVQATLFSGGALTQSLYNAWGCHPEADITGFQLDNAAKKLHAFAEKCSRQTLTSIKSEFSRLHAPEPQDAQVCQERLNAHRNRYSNVLCVDATRVLVRFQYESSKNTYIHANRVHYPTLNSHFIITQGTLQSTVFDFWRMVWQENTEHIIMLCRFFEDQRQKCHEYFNRQKGVPMLVGPNGILRITLADRIADDSGVVTTYLTVEYNGFQRVVTHYHIQFWSDFRAPTNSNSLFAVLRTVRWSKHPIVVHCSAGAGRSGTLVALEMAIMDIAYGNTVDIQSIVRWLRRSRAGAVQTIEQYMFLYKVVLDFAQQITALTEDQCRGFSKLYKQYVESIAPP